MLFPLAIARAALHLGNVPVARHLHFDVSLSKFAELQTFELLLKNKNAGGQFYSRILPAQTIQNSLLKIEKNTPDFVKLSVTFANAMLDCSKIFQHEVREITKVQMRENLSQMNSQLRLALFQQAPDLCQNDGWQLNPKPVLRWSNTTLQESELTEIQQSLIQLFSQFETIVGKRKMFIEEPFFKLLSSGNRFFEALTKSA
jgi:hypothetical protein